MYAYRPDGLPAGAPLVVALHGCTQTATDYYANSGWQKYADLWGFALVFPEQTSANNANVLLQLVPDRATPARGQGEALSVKQMVDYAVGELRRRRRPRLRHRALRRRRDDRGHARHLPGRLRRRLRSSPGSPYRCATSQPARPAACTRPSDKTPAHGATWSAPPTPATPARGPGWRSGTAPPTPRSSRPTAPSRATSGPTCGASPRPRPAPRRLPGGTTPGGLRLDGQTVVPSTGSPDGPRHAGRPGHRGRPVRHRRRLLPGHHLLGVPRRGLLRPERRATRHRPDRGPVSSPTPSPRRSPTPRPARPEPQPEPDPSAGPCFTASNYAQVAAGPGAPVGSARPTPTARTRRWACGTCSSPTPCARRGPTTTCSPTASADRE